MMLISFFQIARDGTEFVDEGKTQRLNWNITNIFIYLIGLDKSSLVSIAKKFQLLIINMTFVTPEKKCSIITTIMTKLCSRSWSRKTQIWKSSVTSCSRWKEHITQVWWSTLSAWRKTWWQFHQHLTSSFKKLYMRIYNLGLNTK